ncbi:MAG TPA: PA0069 family radical SAM protein [Oligoflexus sp.]|uniref:PA0069 family radical SAM protein n=1 Tax=Oligoflexus sp. TaxID=1971216 RepID=UPI002D7F5CC0|nr:PA0069 family radical SAM protein [Oligoflexus sp.]HET9241634.1 PA0069 family radical SAM protein [Oligoflexus sp.]
MTRTTPSDFKNRKSRGARIDPANRFESTRIERDVPPEPWDDPEKAAKTTVLVDHAKTILTKNSSPDICFNYSINAYRGCEHGCAYCYARPTHETLGFNAGLDFETKIMMKVDAPKLLREALMKPSWEPEPIAMSGVTDCYQPVERRYRLTRACLEVLHEFRNPVSIITKNVLILRDLDILAPMAEMNLVEVFISVTSVDRELASKMEPRTPPPEMKLEAIRRLSAAGIPVGVNVAPIVPGLTDKETPKILEAAAEAGARSADYVLLRLPLAVKPIFLDWVEHHYPLRAQHVRTLIEDTRNGELYDTRWGTRQTGEGPYAQQIQTMFKIFAKKFGLDQGMPGLDVSHFRRPGEWKQRELFPNF